MNRQLANIGLVILLAPLTLGLLSSCTSNLAFNEVQFIGSHNSYKQAIDPALLDSIAASSGALAASLDYSHLPLEEQLGLGLRKFELDVLDDPEGDLYTSPLGLKSISNASPYSADSMFTPGFKVMHVQDIDFRSHCQLLSQCLTLLKTWSDDHPKHFPIVITINAKDDAIEQPGFARPLLFDADSWNRLDSEINASLEEKLFSPDDFRGSHSTLQLATQSGWPSLNALRGKFIFVLDHTGEKLASYIEGHESLKGRAMFANAMEGTPEAAIRIVNDPIGQFDYIQSLVSQG